MFAASSAVGAIALTLGCTRATPVAPVEEASRWESSHGISQAADSLNKLTSTRTQLLPPMAATPIQMTKAANVFERLTGSTSSGMSLQLATGEETPAEAVPLQLGTGEETAAESAPLQASTGRIAAAEMAKVPATASSALQACS